MRKIGRGAATRWLLAVSLGLLIASPAQARDGREATPGISIPNFGRINPNYFRGAQPKTHDYADLAALGVKMVIDLTRDGDVTEPGLVQQVGLKFVRIPLTTTERPSSGAVDQFLKLVNDPANQPVYVHCQGGRHRTGVMTAVYRLTHDGWNADRAFSEMKEYEFAKGLGHGALKQFVYDFYTTLMRKPVL
jgi:protein tyrosine/serine phosphatase